MFTSSTTWTVPAGVSSAFVTMAGGGGSGAGWRVTSTTYTGHSGGYVFSQPVNLVAGETMSVVVGRGGIGYEPVANAMAAWPYYFYTAPAGDDGLGGYPGESSKLVSPSAGTLLECSGGSGVAFGGIDNYAGGKVAGNLDGANTGSGSPSFPAPNRVATGSYVTANGPGACGPALYGIGNPGTASWSVSSGNRTGGQTPFGYGSGGNLWISGCYVTPTTGGTCIGASYGRNGVVFIDVLY
jgi:hypothetical protein